MFEILEFFNLFLVTVQSAKVNLPQYRTPRDGHWTNQMTVKLSINNIYIYIYWEERNRKKESQNFDFQKIYKVEIVTLILMDFPDTLSLKGYCLPAA